MYQSLLAVLRQSKSRKSEIRRRRLYTPHSPSEEEEEERRNQWQSKSLDEEIQRDNDEKCVSRNEQAISEQAILNERAENLTLKDLKPILRKSIPGNPFSTGHRFNTKDAALECTKHLSSFWKIENDRYSETFKEQVKIMLEKRVSSQRSCNQVTIRQEEHQQQNFNEDADEGEEVTGGESELISAAEDIPDDQLNKTRESSHQNSQIKSSPLVVVNDNDCEMLEQMFTQHEKSTAEVHTQPSNRSNGINHRHQFVPSQFTRCENYSDGETVSKENVDNGDAKVERDEAATTTKAGNNLISVSQTLDEWLNESVCELKSASSSPHNEGPLLSRSKLKVDQNRHS